MNRVLLLIAVLFGLASISGPTMVTAMATGNQWKVASQELCVEAGASHLHAPVFKPCSKKINGHAVMCQQPAAVIPAVEGCNFTPRTATFFSQQDSAGTAPADGRRFRPPRAA